MRSVYLFYLIFLFLHLYKINKKETRVQYSHFFTVIQYFRADFRHESSSDLK